VKGSMETIAGTAALVRTRSGVGLGIGRTGSASTSSLHKHCEFCSSTLKTCGTFYSLKSSSSSSSDDSNSFSGRGNLFLPKASAHVQGSTRKINGSRVKGANTGGHKAEDAASDALSTVVQPTALEVYEKSPAFRAVLAAIASVALAAEKQRRLEQISGKTQVPVDALRQGRLVESRLVYRQTFVIRSYEVGADRTASIETLMNHFQETALNHVWMSGLAGDGFGATHAMVRSNLIWVVTRMQVHVERYPAWGDVVEMDTWVAGSGKNGMRRDWLVRDYKTGQILARATSTWVMMNKKTRRLSKMPDEVRAEICPYFLERSAIKDEGSNMQKINKLDDSAEHVRSGLTPRRSDLDMNQHVNNVKYIGWMMESIPCEILDGHELASMTLEYRRECGQSDTVQSMTSPDPSTSDSECAGRLETNGASKSRIVSYAAGTLTMTPEVSKENSSVGPLQFVHLLRMQMDGAEIVRGRTHWRLKRSPSEQQQ